MKVNTYSENLMLGQAIPIFFSWLETKGMKMETARGYKIDLDQFNRWLTKNANGPVLLKEIVREDIEEFILYLKNNLKSKPSTINRKLNSLSSFYSCMKRKKIVNDNILDDIDRVKVPQTERVYLTKEEVDAVIQHISHPVVHYLVIMMANTGIRVKECTHLTLEHVNLEEKMVYVVNGKGGKDRNVPMNENLVKYMEEYLAKHRPNTDSNYFFALKKTGSISTQYVNETLKKAYKEAGIKKHVTSHILRHSFASYLVKNDTHVAIIQRLLGHADVRTTSVYMHVQQDDLKKAVNQIEF